MNRIVLVFLFTIFLGSAKAQVPPYTATVYDTTVSGYYFLSPGISAANYMHMVLDAKGNLVYYRNFPNLPTFDFKVQPNGHITYFTGNRFYEMDSTFMIIDTIVAVNGFATNVHDLQILPNGHYLLLANETEVTDLSSYNYFSGTGAPGSATASVRANLVQELDENENLVHECHLYGVLSFDSVDPFWLFSPSVVDWTHSNAVDVDLDGNYLVSTRHFNEITKINASTGAVMWWLGGNYNQFMFLNDSLRFYGQHDVRVLPNGNITLFDNGDHTIPHGARAVEYQLDTVNMTAELIWSYTYDTAMYSNAMGNNQRLSNGNRLINYGAFNAEGNVSFDVVREDNSKVFELSFADSLYSYRAFFYEQLPWSFHRPQIMCYDSAGSHYLDAGAGYGSYTWSTGATTRIIEITSADTFFVRVPYGQNGNILSENFVVSDMLNPCGITAMTETQGDVQFSIYPVPAKDVVNVILQKSNARHLTISDITGRTVYEKEIDGRGNSIAVDVSSLDNGLYYISVDGNTAKFVKEK
jgi:hypothetical protein